LRHFECKRAHFPLLANRVPAHLRSLSVFDLTFSPRQSNHEKDSLFLPLSASFRVKGFHERFAGGLRNCPYRERWVSNIAALGEGVEPARIVADVMTHNLSRHALPRAQGVRGVVFASTPTRPPKSLPRRLPAEPMGAVQVFCNRSGRPYSKDTLGDDFRDVRARRSVTRKSGRSLIFGGPGQPRHWPATLRLRSCQRRWRTPCPPRTGCTTPMPLCSSPPCAMLTPRAELAEPS
jgi:hypothetical protein